ncbi:Uncharacterised protein [BD1-7 clade bacterium]|uniref:6-hydroxymethylpterin diphosphokinase MptE-like domain-containing protein n=1 Tax=BD1-7 clade bacterium TaxID=2029982 RepID=A0A5S9QZL9_9GAMM|nr:Uncharacterised protein [BD1-7 clade bacterium]
MRSWKSRHALQRIKDQHRGEKAVILCNGPSLNRIDLTALDGVFTLGLNKINLLFEQTTFRPSVIVSVNPHVIQQNREFFKATDIPIFLSHRASRSFAKQENTTFLHMSDYPIFSTDCSLSVYEGYTVTFVAMQLAFHLGFQNVALVGCDHHFNNTQGKPNEEQQFSGNDSSHFSSAYFSDGQTWQIPDLDNSNISYLMALKAFTKNGRGLYNASIGGKLECLPRVGLTDFLAA